MKPQRVSDPPEPRGRRDKRNQILDAAIRVFARLGLRVGRLRRVSIGGLNDRGLRVGHWRPMIRGEVRALS